MQNIFSHQALGHSFELSWQLIAVSELTQMFLTVELLFMTRLVFTQTHLPWSQGLISVDTQNPLRIIFYYSLLVSIIKKQAVKKAKLTFLSLVNAYLKWNIYMLSSKNSYEQIVKKKFFSSFQRTPSFRRKWRKRYGGLDGNKLLEPNKEDDTRGTNTTLQECRRCVAVNLVFPLTVWVSH